jgi:hypothetical protein
MSWGKPMLRVAGNVEIAKLLGGNGERWSDAQFISIYISGGYAESALRGENRVLKLEQSFFFYPILITIPRFLKMGRVPQNGLFIFKRPDGNGDVLKLLRVPDMCGAPAPRRALPEEHLERFFSSIH